MRELRKCVSESVCQLFVCENTIPPRCNVYLNAFRDSVFVTRFLSDLFRINIRVRFSFDWDTPLQTILGDEFVLYTEELTTKTTLRDILAHRTGVPGYFVSLLSGFTEQFNRKQLIR